MILHIMQGVRCAMILLSGITCILVTFELLILRDLVQLRLLFQILELLHDLLLVHFKILALIIYELILRSGDFGMQCLEFTHGLFSCVQALVLL